MTHVGAAGSTLAPPANVVRLSIGLESARDLIADLERALALPA
jgi:cystathionine gamma-synthase